MSTQLAERPKVQISSKLAGMVPGTAADSWAGYELLSLMTENEATANYYKEIAPILDRDSGSQTLTTTSGDVIVLDVFGGSLDQLSLREFAARKNPRFGIQEIMRRLDDRVAQETPLTVRTPPVSLQIARIRSASVPALAAYERANQLRTWFHLPWSDLAMGLGVDESTFFNWQKKPTGTPRPVSVARLDAFWGFSKAVHEQMDADGFRQWSVAPAEGDRSPKELLKLGDLDTFRRATRSFVRPRRPRSQRPQRPGIGAWSPEFDD